MNILEHIRRKSFAKLSVGDSSEMREYLDGWFVRHKGAGFFYFHHICFGPLTKWLNCPLSSVP